jgi:hypothetical protein
MKCKECDQELKYDYEMSTCVGYSSPPGHNHDNNCLKRYYYCDQGHKYTVSKRRKCPNPTCSWAGKETCWCHPDPKVDKWPDE